MAVVAKVVAIRVLRAGKGGEFTEFGRDDADCNADQGDDADLAEGVGGTQVAIPSVQEREREREREDAILDICGFMAIYSTQWYSEYTNSTNKLEYACSS